MSGRIVTFGEIMGRIAPGGFKRFSQALPGSVELTFGGGEANVAVSLAVLGTPAAFVTALPRNAAADACEATLRRFGVDTRFIVRTDEGRLGLYYLEPGANQRPSQVTYDRDGSAVMRTSADAYPWEEIFADSTWFHITGITPALSARAAEAARTAAQTAKDRGLTVSCDLNYRKKLWTWEPGTPRRELAGKTMRSILPFVDVVVGNEEDAEKVLGIEAAGTDVESGELNIAAYREVASTLVEQFPTVRTVAITLRESLSATHNNWGAMLYDAETGQAHFAPTDADGNYRPYEIRAIVDRVGGGDSFSAGLIYALTHDEWSAPEDAVRFAAAASCLKHSIPGDFNLATRSEVEALAAGRASGRVSR